jgi:hypothetical protein
MKKMKKILLVLSLVLLVSVGCGGEKIYGTFEPSGFGAGLSFDGSTAYIHMLGGKIPVAYEITTLVDQKTGRTFKGIEFTMKNNGLMAGPPKFIFYGEILKVDSSGKIQEIDIPYLLGKYRRQES